MKTSNKILICCASALAAFIGYKIYKNQLKQVDQEYKKVDEEAKELGINNPVEEQYTNKVPEDTNIIERVYGIILRQADTETVNGKKKKFFWNFDLLKNEYYKNPDKFRDREYFWNTLHIVRNWKEDDTITFMFFLPPYNDRTKIDSYSYVNYFRDLMKTHNIKGRGELAGFYEYEEIDNEGNRTIEFATIPADDYDSESPRGLYQFMTNFNYNPDFYEDSVPEEVTNVYVASTFTIHLEKDGSDTKRIMKILQLFSKTEIFSKMEEVKEISKCEGIVFHPEADLSVILDFEDNEDKIEYREKKLFQEL